MSVSATYAGKLRHVVIPHAEHGPIEEVPIKRNKRSWPVFYRFGCATDSWLL